MLSATFLRSGLPSAGVHSSRCLSWSLHFSRCLCRSLHSFRSPGRSFHSFRHPGRLPHSFRRSAPLPTRGRGAGGGGGGGGGGEPLSGGFSAACRGTIKCNFTAIPQAGKKRFPCLFQIKYILYLWILWNCEYSSECSNRKDLYEQLYEFIIRSTYVRKIISVRNTCANFASDLNPVCANFAESVLFINEMLFT